MNENEISMTTEQKTDKDVCMLVKINYKSGHYQYLLVSELEYERNNEISWKLAPRDIIEEYNRKCANLDKAPIKIMEIGINEIESIWVVQRLIL